MMTFVVQQQIQVPLKFTIYIVAVHSIIRDYSYSQSHAQGCPFIGCPTTFYNVIMFP